MAGLLAVSALRIGAAQVAASACSVAIAWATHHRLDAQRPLWPAAALVPLSAPIAAGVMIGVGVGVAKLGYGAPLRASWQSIRAVAMPGDALFGLALACALAIVLGALALLLERRLSALRAGLLVRIVVALLATGLIASVVQGALGALSLAGEEGARNDRAAPAPRGLFETGHAPVLQHLDSVRREGRAQQRKSRSRPSSSLAGMRTPQWTSSAQRPNACRAPSNTV
ncbi:MAG: hypothetical protein ABI193_03370 [Minicystis sp.]